MAKKTVTVRGRKYWKSAADVARDGRRATRYFIVPCIESAFVLTGPYGREGLPEGSLNYKLRYSIVAAYPWVPAIKTLEKDLPTYRQAVARLRFWRNFK